jgi:RNA polymerase-binding protein DksA
MKKAELDQYKQLLLELRTRCNGDLSQLAGDLGGLEKGSASMPADPGDLGSETFDQEFNFSLVENEEEVLAQIDVALQRIAKGNYGLCESCQQPIPKERLLFLPYTPHCVQCARKLEKHA